DLVAGAAGAERELHGYRGRGEVADLALELEVGVPAVGRRDRHADLHEDLVGLERGRERAGEERCDGDPALARRACGDDLGAEREHRGGVVVGGIAVGEVAAERGQGSHQGIRDDRPAAGRDLLNSTSPDDRDEPRRRIGRASLGAKHYRGGLTLARPQAREPLRGGRGFYWCSNVPLTLQRGEAR